MRPETTAPQSSIAAADSNDADLEARYVVHYVASNDVATYTGTQTVWAHSEAEAERKARALLEPYCANPLTGNLRLAITAIVRDR